MGLDALYHKVVASQYGPHPFEWVIDGGTKRPNKNRWKAINFVFHSCSSFIKCSVGEGTNVS